MPRSAAPSATGSVLAYGGVSPTAPIDASAGQANASSTAVTAPSITTTVADARIVGLFANTTLVYNDYKFRFGAAQNNFEVNLSSGIRDGNAKH